MAEHNSQIAKELRKELLWPIVVGMILIVAAGYYSVTYFNRVSLKYYSDASIIVRTGEKEIDKNIPNLSVDISNIQYKQKKLNSIRIFKFRILNDSKKHLPKGASFYVQASDGSPLPGESVVDILFHPQLVGNEIIRAIKQPYDVSYGHSFRLDSSLPSSSFLAVSVVIDESELGVVNLEKIELKKDSRKSEKMDRIFSPESIITLSYLQLFLIVISGAFVYGSAWLIISILRRNYSTGMEVIDRLLLLLFGRTLFLKNYDDSKSVFIDRKR